MNSNLGIDGSIHFMGWRPVMSPTRVCNLVVVGLMLQGPKGLAIWR